MQRLWLNVLVFALAMVSSMVVQPRITQANTSPSYTIDKFVEPTSSRIIGSSKSPMHSARPILPQAQSSTPTISFNPGGVHVVAMNGGNPTNQPEIIFNISGCPLDSVATLKGK
jgi:hypothetical protein